MKRNKRNVILDMMHKLLLDILQCLVYDTELCHEQQKKLLPRMLVKEIRLE